MTALSETVHVEGGGERAIKSLPEQAGMTHTTEFIQEGGWERGKQKREEERPASSSRFKIISGNKPKEEAVVAALHTNPSTRTKAMSERKQR